MRAADAFSALIASAAALKQFQATLNGLPTPEAQKVAITEAVRAGTINHDDAELLIQVYQLETA